MNYRTQIPADIVPRSWLGRLIAVLIAAGLAVVGLFFIAFALVAAAGVAVIVVARIWWVSRKLRARQDNVVIEGAYSVEPERIQAVHAESANSGGLPPDPK